MFSKTDLGPLERRLMEALWILGESSVGQLQQASSMSSSAYTTIMTTLDRLYKKGFLNRRKQGRAFFYAPYLSRAEFERGLVRTTLRSLLFEHSNAMAPLMANLIDSLQEYDAKMLDDLESLIQQKKRARRRR